MFSTAKIIDCSRLTQINNILLESFNNMFIIYFELYLRQKTYNSNFTFGIKESENIFIRY